MSAKKLTIQDNIFSESRNTLTSISMEEMPTSLKDVLLQLMRQRRQRKRAELRKIEIEQATLVKCRPQPQTRIVHIYRDETEEIVATPQQDQKDQIGKRTEPVLGKYNVVADESAGFSDERIHSRNHEEIKEEEPEIEKECTIEIKSVLTIHSEAANVKKHVPQLSPSKQVSRLGLPPRPSPRLPKPPKKAAAVKELCEERRQRRCLLREIEAEQLNRIERAKERNVFHECCEKEAPQPEVVIIPRHHKHSSNVSELSCISELSCLSDMSCLSLSSLFQERNDPLLVSSFAINAV